MKIKLLSDLHLEGYPYHYEYAGEDVVVLAGDIHNKYRHEFILDQIPNNVKILFVAGNHEYYGEDFDEVNNYFYKLQADYSNFYWLHNGSVLIDDVDFFGGTMFTNWELHNDSWTAKQKAKEGIADFHWITKKTKDGVIRRWNPEDHLQEHLTFRQNIDNWLWLNGPAQKRVVISHFVPHREGSDPKYVGSNLNPYFICDMSEYMKGVDLWLYGHTHSSKDMMEGNCRLVCNPRGYGSENSHGFTDQLILEI